MQAADPMHNTCGAHTRNGGTCQRPPGWGTTHTGVGRCKNHGGSSPRAEVAGAIQLAQHQATVMGTPLAVAPHEALLQCIAIAAGEVVYSTDQIAKLEEHQAVEDTMFGQQVNIWIKVRHASMDRLATYSKIALAANIAEREVRVAEAQGQMIATAIRGVLDELGIGDNADVPRLVRKHLTLVAGE